MNSIGPLLLVFYLFYYLHFIENGHPRPTHLGGFAVALRHAVGWSHPGHHTDGKGIPDANAMLYLLQNNINALTLQCQYGPI